MLPNQNLPHDSRQNHKRPPELTWTGWDILLAIFFFFFTYAIVNFFSRQFFLHYSENGWFIFLSRIISDSIFFAIMILLAHQKKDPLFQVLRFNKTKIKQTTLILLGAILIAISAIFLTHLFPPNTPPPLEAYLKTKIDLLVFSFLGIIFAPFVEEIFFRGILYPFFETHMPKFLAIFMVGSMFGFLHIGQLSGFPLGIGIIFLVGYLTTFIRATWNSTTLAWIFHLTYNFFWVVFAWFTRV